jgi:positive regulator of sigma E activity
MRRKLQLQNTDINPRNSEPGLITRIDEGSMYVKVPLGLGCKTCPNKSACTFSGPERAYRTFRVRRIQGCRVGDRVLVHESGATLAITWLVLVVLPLVLILAGYGLLTCCVQFPYATFVLWVIGVALWIAAMYAANLWVERGVHFRERVQPVTNLRHKSERIEKSRMEGR